MTAPEPAPGATGTPADPVAPGGGAAPDATELTGPVAAKAPLVPGGLEPVVEVPGAGPGARPRRRPVAPKRRTSLRDRWTRADAEHVPTLPLGAVRGLVVTAALLPFALLGGLGGGPSGAAGGLAYALSVGLAAGAATLVDRGLTGHHAWVLRSTATWLTFAVGAAVAWLDGVYAAGAARGGPEEGLRRVADFIGHPHGAVVLLATAGSFASASLLARPESHPADPLVIGGGPTLCCLVLASALVEPASTTVPLPVAIASATLGLLVGCLFLALPVACFMYLLFSVADRVALRRWPRATSERT